MSDDEEARNRLQEQLAKRAKRAWSDGRINAQDDGDLALAIGPHPTRKLVIIDFGKQVEWIALPPEQAIQLAQTIIKHAKAIS